MITFQEVILRLQEYWNRQGCALLQPIDLEVGAGTSHTATFLRALGPEPWRAAYVQPSRRPKDGRYGENPNRLQQHHQYQVVLKPAPTNIVDLYLGSLRAGAAELQLEAAELAYFDNLAFAEVAAHHVDQFVEDQFHIARRGGGLGRDQVAQFIHVARAGRIGTGVIQFRTFGGIFAHVFAQDQFVLCWHNIRIFR